MAAAGYTPAPGSVAAGVLAHLSTLGVGVEVRASDLVDAIGCSRNGLDAGLESAKRHGAIVYRLHKPPRGRSVAMWSLPTDDDAPPVHRTIPASQAMPLGWKPSPLDAAWHPLARCARGWRLMQIAALFVETDGAYSGLPGVDPWDEAKDARKYRGPHSVVAHPDCQRWGRYWHGAPNKPHQFRLGEDGGCFAAALTAVRNYGGVLEHPAHSRAWRYFGLSLPPARGGWVKADDFGGRTCYVEQGHYGHMARKGTWLYAVSDSLPELRWERCEQRIHPRALELHGYAKARRIGMLAMVGGKDKTRIRNATPPPFRDVLLDIARTCRAERLAA